MVFSVDKLGISVIASAILGMSCAACERNPTPLSERRPASADLLLDAVCVSLAADDGRPIERMLRFDYSQKDEALQTLKGIVSSRGESFDTQALFEFLNNEIPACTREDVEQLLLFLEDHDRQDILAMYSDADAWRYCAGGVKGDSVEAVRVLVRASRIEDRKTMFVVVLQAGSDWFDSALVHLQSSESGWVVTGKVFLWTT